MRGLDECTETDERVDAFCPIRGVGTYAVRPVIAEIGDITRFELPACFCSSRDTHASRAPVPGRPQPSGAPIAARLGHGSRQGSMPLRSARVDAAQHSVRCARTSSGSRAVAGQLIEVSRSPTYRPLLGGPFVDRLRRRRGPRCCEPRRGRVFLGSALMSGTALAS
jgi:hypothetical protein